MRYPTHPEWDIDNMLSASWTFGIAGNALSRLASDAARVGHLGDGPVFDRAAAELARLTRRVQLVSTAVTAVGNKLLADAEEESLYRKLNAAMDAAEADGGSK